MSTISNERLDSIERQFIEDGFNDITDSEVVKLVSEVRALRKERELAVPVAWTDVEELNDAKTCGWGYLFTVDPVSPNADPRRVIKLYAEGPAKPIDDDSLPFDPQIAEYEQMMEAEQSEAATDTTAQQFESLAFKSVVPEGWKLVPIELTKEMREAFHQANEEWEEVGATWSPDHQWKAMLAAAPEPCK